MLLMANSGGVQQWKRAEVADAKAFVRGGVPLFGLALFESSNAPHIASLSLSLSLFRFSEWSCDPRDLLQLFSPIICVSVVATAFITLYAFRSSPLQHCFWPFFVTRKHFVPS